MSPFPVSALQLNRPRGTATDIDGQYSITTEHPLPLSLTFSFLGFRTQEVDVYEFGEEIHVVLSEEANILGEVV